MHRQWYFEQAKTVALVIYAFMNILAGHYTSCLVYFKIYVTKFHYAEIICSSFLEDKNISA